MHANESDQTSDALDMQVERHRIVGAAEAARFCNFSPRHWRRMYLTGKAPAPIKLSTRKVGWKLGTLIDFASGARV